jgi:hypothetical protein
VGVAARPACHETEVSAHRRLDALRRAEAIGMLVAQNKTLHRGDQAPAGGRQSMRCSQRLRNGVASRRARATTASLQGADRSDSLHLILAGAAPDALGLMALSVAKRLQEVRDEFGHCAPRPGHVLD